MVQKKAKKDEMNVIWVKDKIMKTSKESINTSALASGDGYAGRRCGICGTLQGSLRQVVEDGLHQMLEQCFKVQALPGCMVCETCVKIIKLTARFRILVLTAFEKGITDDSSNHTKILARLVPDEKLPATTNPEKEIIELLKTNMATDKPKRREIRKKYSMNLSSHELAKKVLVICTLCKQKYAMIIQEGCKHFVCSRCKKNEGNMGNKKIEFPLANGRLDAQKKDYLKGKCRLNSLPKKPLQVKLNHSVTKFGHLPKYSCNMCPKKYSLAENLALHLKNAHQGNLTLICDICGQRLRRKDLIAKHPGLLVCDMKEHGIVKILQCNDCMRVFKSKRALETHCNTHEREHGKSMTIQ